MTYTFNILKRISIIIIIIAILSIFVLPIKDVYAATTYTQSLKSGIDNFPKEYQEVLKQIQKLHPNWNFEAYNTGIDWDTVVLNETSTHGRNRIIKSSSTAYKCSCNNIASGYSCASEGIIKYYLDPRNFLNEVNIFQFLEISYNSKIHNIDGIKSAIKDTFMDKEVTYILTEQEEVEDEKTGEKIIKDVDKEYTKHYAEIILEAAKESNMSPYSIATKIIQEVGTKGSSSVTGTYEGYNGYYNFYNLGAYDTGNAIVNALKYARDKGWNNQYTAIIEGAKEIANSYTNAGQNTAYFYKWDVVGTKILKSGESQSVSSSNMFWHQYMTNVQDPTSQSKSLYNTYVKNNIIEKELNFIIPVYNNMPSGITPLPTELTEEDGDLYYVNCTDGLAVREKPSTSDKVLTRLGKNTVVVVLERECAEANEFKWDKVKLSNGLTGYVASKYLTLKIESTKVMEEETSNVKTQDVENYSNEYCKYENENIIVVPGTTLSNIDSSATGELKTGGKIKVKDKEYDIVILGDINGDGSIDTGDTFVLKKHIKEVETISDNLKNKAADLNNDGSIDTGDSFILKKHIKEVEKISIK